MNLFGYDASYMQSTYVNIKSATAKGFCGITTTKICILLNTGE